MMSEDAKQAEAQKADSTQSQAQESAPEKKNPGDSGSGKVEAFQASLAPDWFKAEIAKVREKKREAQSEAERWKSEYEKVKAQIDAVSQRQSEQSSETQDTRTPQFNVEDIEKRVLDRLRGEQKRAEVESQKVKAGEWLRTRPELIEDPNFAREVVSLIDSDQDLSEMVDRYPMRAAKAAYVEMCERKGINPSLGAPSGDYSSANAQFGPAASGATSRGASKPKASDYNALLDGANLGDAKTREALKAKLKALKEADGR